MRIRTRCSVSALIAGSLILSQAATDDLAKAIEKLAEAGGYSWKATSESPQFNMGPTVGKMNKEGVTLLSRTFGDTSFQTVHHGEKAAMETQDGWRSLAELEADQGDNRGRFRSRMLRNFEAPAAEAAGLLKSTTDVKLVDGAYAGVIAEDKVKEMLSFRGRGAGDGDAPAINGAEGSVKFWIENGMLKKYQYAVKGTVNWNNQDREVDRTTTVEISDVGSTKVEVPEAAKAKL